MIRLLETTPGGTPLEFILYIKANGIVIFESMRTEIFIHLMAVMPYFELKIFQVEFREK